MTLLNERGKKSAMSKKINDGLTPQQRYESKMQKLQIKLSKEDDKDILEWLEKMPSKQAYLKELIRQDIERNKNS